MGGKGSGRKKGSSNISKNSARKSAGGKVKGGFSYTKGAAPRAPFKGK